MDRDAEQVEGDWLLERGRTPEEVARMQAAASGATVWLVIGVCGEYSDRNEWVVAAYLDKSLAEQHADLATQEERRLLREWEAADLDMYDFRHGNDSTHAEMRRNRYDAKVQRSYTGTDYHAAESCELRTSLPIVDEPPVAAPEATP